MTVLKPTEISVKAEFVDNWQDIIRAAWINSRPNVKPEEVNFVDVLKIDTPVSEMAGIVLNLYIPIYFRELLANMRDHIIWARTSRIDNLTEVWPIVNHATQDDMIKMQGLIDQMTGEKDAGASQDKFRQNLPLGYMTGLTCRLSIRSAFKLIKFFNYFAEKHPNVRHAATDFSFKLMKVLSEADIPVAAVLPAIKMQDFAPSLDLLQAKSGTVGNTVVIYQTMPISLRAQVIRHRTIHVTDSLADIADGDDIWAIPISSKMFVEISATKEIWSSIVAKRNCWLAQADIWNQITQEVNKVLGTQEFMLPCKDGVCPFDGDSMERLRKTDPGLPCPRHVHLMKQEDILSENFGPDITDQMKKYVVESGRPIEYWQGEIDKLSGN